MHSDTPHTTPRRLTRSTTDAPLTGISAGLGEHLNVDPRLVRTGFVVTTLLSGAGMLAYLALLFVMPKADEPAHVHPIAA